MADLTIGQLPAASSVSDAALFVLEQNGTAQSATGAQWKGYAQAAVASQVSAAQASAQAAASSAQAAQAAQAAAQIAQAGAQAAQQSAETAEQAIENMTVSSATLSSDSPATVVKSASGDSFNLFFGIPKGPQGIQGPQGPQGIQGPPGPQGINGVAVAAEGQYAFNVDSNGHLILFYEGNTIPDFSIGANGHLYYNFEEATINAAT